MDHNTATQEAITAELHLLDPHLRADPARARALLEEDFTEYGSSGTVYDREAILDLLARENSGGAVRHRPHVHGLTGHELAPGLVQLTFTTSSAEHRSLRSSLWRQGTDGIWRCLFHQTTPTRS
ncbi:nuclear transport factor 2 family protein [Nocardiopsis xinjiangensis]|uniref:nuclear transport factor 2 family protein n=1 Tax=Nocardiopsis xinjiangensis TaxID=124285 RepID=UPI0003467F6C|nr:nuclear transport factor 2 family protein [Nocardiopsis xinjiangensis]